MASLTDYIESNFLLAILAEDFMEARRQASAMTDRELRDLRVALSIALTKVEDEEYERKRRERAQKP